MSLTNSTDRAVKASVIVVSRDALAHLLGVDPADVLAWELDTVGGLSVVYTDLEDGYITPPGACFMIKRRLSLKTTREIMER